MILFLLEIVKYNHFDNKIIYYLVIFIILKLIYILFDIVFSSCFLSLSLNFFLKYIMNTFPGESTVFSGPSWFDYAWASVKSTAAAVASAPSK